VNIYNADEKSGADGFRIENPKERDIFILMKIPIILNSFKEGGYCFFINVMINNCPTLALVDTGATRCGISNEFAEKIGLPSIEKEQKSISASGAFQAKKAEITISLSPGFDLPNITVSVNDYSALQADLQKENMPMYDMIVGNDVFLYFRAKIDFTNLTIDIKQNYADR
jgi:hypothetical protein